MDRATLLITLVYDFYANVTEVLKNMYSPNGWRVLAAPLLSCFKYCSACRWQVFAEE